MLYALLKSRKQNCFSKFFESNWNMIKNTWKEIISLITSKDISSNVSTAVFLVVLKICKVAPVHKHDF